MIKRNIDALWYLAIAVYNGETVRLPEGKWNVAKEGLKIVSEKEAQRLKKKVDAASEALEGVLAAFEEIFGSAQAARPKKRKPRAKAPGETEAKVDAQPSGGAQEDSAPQEESAPVKRAPTPKAIAPRRLSAIAKAPVPKAKANGSFGPRPAPERAGARS